MYIGMNYLCYMMIGRIRIKAPLRNEISKFYRYLNTLLILFIFTQLANSQFIYYDLSDSTDWSNIKLMVDSGRDIRDSFQGLGYPTQTFFIHHVEDKIWMSVDGRFDVFEWQSDKWVNLYKGTYHGYNYKSQKFTYGGRLFSYKGYGFWREHGEIIEFLPEKAGWEIIPESKDLPYGIGYVIDSSFYIHSSNCFKVDLLEQNVESVPCEYTIRDKIPHGREYIFDDYILVASILEDGTQFPLIEKNSGTVYLSHRQPFNGIRDPRMTDALIHIKDNQMTIVFQDNDTLTYSTNSELKYYVKESGFGGQTPFWIWWVLFIFIFATLIFLFYRYYPRRHHSDVEILSAFKGYEGQLIDSDTLDAILGIEDIVVYETRKHRRASLIKEINALSEFQYGQDLILREKNPMDKRFYLYRIRSLGV